MSNAIDIKVISAPPVVAEMELITPEVAKRLLEDHRNFRPLRTLHVTQLARAMREGRWESNGQTIVIAEDGSLLDGQHRMRAIIISSCSIWMLVARQVARRTVGRMDCNKPRSLADTVYGAGYTKNRMNQAGMARWADLWNRNQGKGITTDPDEAVRILGRMHELGGVDEAIAATVNKGARDLCTLGTAVSSVALVVWLAHQDDAKQAGCWCDAIFKAEPWPQPGEPAHTLWLRVARSRQMLRQMGAVESIRLFWECYVAHRDTLSVKSFRLRGRKNIYPQGGGRLLRRLLAED